MNKTLLFIASEKGFTVLEHAIKQGRHGEIACVVSFNESDVALDYCPLIEELCTAHGITFYLWKDVRGRTEEVIKKHQATSAVAISWKWLIPLSINSMLENPLIIFHDSLLPKYRGFAPTPTAIICGENEVGITAIYAVEEVDKGDIILQRKIEVSQDEYIKQIIEKLSGHYAEMFCELLDMLASGNISAYPQDESMATYSIWRSPEDCEIDWYQDAKKIYNFIRAVGDPYPGAFTNYNGQKIIIEIAVVEEDLNFVERSPGKIWSINNNRPLVVCESGMLRILTARDIDGNAVRFNKLRCRLGNRPLSR